ncbi:MAG TPA: amidohydrolase family protein [Kofleriaceae bacterium]|nr:amidohydrolase family protein [Kofleriaceae bacterium]
MRRTLHIGAAAIVVAVVAVVAAAGGGAPPAPPAPYAIDDAHVHLTNYIQEGIGARDLLRVMGNQVGRAVLFGIPLQQMWSSRVDRGKAPTYYLDSDSPLYYYSFTDAYIAMAYLGLSKTERARFDPMITGFNPADMYAADHVRRVLQTFPGVFEGIGEFSLHKEFVTSKIAGDPPSLEDPALDRLFGLAEEAGLVALVHCDIDTPFPKPGAPPAYLDGIVALFKRHPHARIIWAHIGLGRVVRPVQDQAAFVAAMLDDPALAHVSFDLSWSETAKYIVASPATIRVVADLVIRHPDRFLYGSDEVAPANQDDYLRVYRQYQPLWDQLPPRVLAQVLRGNYERIFDEARRRVRAWEQSGAAHATNPEPVVHRATGPD